MKYSLKFKLKMIKLKKEGKMLEYPTECSRSTFRHKVRFWERIYDLHGEKGLEHKTKSLSINEKETLVKRVLNGESITEISVLIGKETSEIIKWCKLYRQDGIDELKLKKRGRKPTMPRKDKETNKNTENKKSKYTDEEIEYILAENEYLKKLNALIQEKNQKTNIK